MLVKNYRTQYRFNIHFSQELKPEEKAFWNIYDSTEEWKWETRVEMVSSAYVIKVTMHKS